ncbi:MAG: FAD-binding protein [Legionella sp.]|nr:MAG: FAD-binding protein [Legionella sp.]
MNHHFDVLIVGGGVVGLTAALAMAARQYRVAVIDAQSLTVNISAPDLRVYAINQASENLLKELDVWEKLESTRLSPYLHMHVWDAANGAYIDFDARQIASAKLGSILEESILKQALLTQIATQTTISLFPQCAVDAVTELAQGVEIKSQDQVWQGDLLMIADGANSPTRNNLGVTLTTWSYQQHALVATVATEKPHQQTAYQVFNSDGPLAFLPLANPQQCSIVWSTTPAKAQRLLDLEENEFNEELTQAFAEKLGQVRVMSTRHQFPLQMRHVKQYSGKRWILLGDAAHTIHPLAGLGLNVGLADVRSWLHFLDKAKGTLHSKKLLGAYHRERQHAVWQIILQMEGFKRLFSPEWSSLSTLRGLGLRACNEFAPLKRLFIQQASGLSALT